MNKSIITILLTMLCILVCVIGSQSTSDFISPHVGAMKKIPTGQFQRDDNPNNISKVSEFLMSSLEVTRQTFLDVMSIDPVEKLSGCDRISLMTFPVHYINWYHAIAFCNKLSLAEGLTPVYAVKGVDFFALSYDDIPCYDNNKNWDAVSVNLSNNGYRLPTEMEWMWAAMGADATAPGQLNTTGYKKLYAGYTNVKDPYEYVWYNRSFPNPVGLKRPNELGLLDLSGNASEWCWDAMAEYPSGLLVDYQGGSVNSAPRVHRGGNFTDKINVYGVADRSNLNPGRQNKGQGLRVVRNTKPVVARVEPEKLSDEELYIDTKLAGTLANSKENVPDAETYVAIVESAYPSMLIGRKKLSDQWGRPSIESMARLDSFEGPCMEWQSAVSTVENSDFYVSTDSVSISESSYDAASKSWTCTVTSSDPAVPYAGKVLFKNVQLNTAIKNNTLKANIRYKLKMEAEAGFRWRLGSLVLVLMDGSKKLGTQNLKGEWTFTAGKRLNPIAVPFMPMELVKGGSFTLVKKAKVSVSTFYIGRTEVTQSQYESIMGNNPSAGKNEADSADRPVEEISWYDAVDFCNALSTKEGLPLAYTIKGKNVTLKPGSNGYRLPTEAEWEFAAQGGNQKAFQEKYNYRSGRFANEAWYDDNSSRKTHPVASKSANRIGIYDIFGNVWEWCNDWNAKTAKAQVDPLGPASGREKVFRGGSYINSSNDSSLSTIYGKEPTEKSKNFGFRVARSLSSAEKRMLAIKRNQASVLNTPATTLVVRKRTNDEQTIKTPNSDFVSANIGTLKFVPAGTFQYSDSVANTSTISSLRMSQYEITRAQYLAIMGNDRSDPSNSTGKNSPVLGVSWYDAVEFCNRLSEKEGLKPVYTMSNRVPEKQYPIRSAKVEILDWTADGYRLPTEMEWMWAAMGADKDRTPGAIVDGVNVSGYKKDYAGANNNDDSRESYRAYLVDSSDGWHICKPVGEKKPNELGLYDMSGNAREWIWDRFGYSGVDQRYAIIGPLFNYRGPASGAERGIRGGSVESMLHRSYTVSKRGFAIPASTFDDLGFRVVRTHGAVKTGTFPIKPGQVIAVKPQSNNPLDYQSPAIGTLKYVPAGSFQRDDKAANLSVLTKSFRMSEKEISRAQYVAVTKAKDPANSYSNSTKNPVQEVTWYDAVEFCNLLSVQEGLKPVYSISERTPATGYPIKSATVLVKDWNANGYRLPTEAEWQWAAMGAKSEPDSYKKPFAGSNGANNIGDYAVYGYSDAEKKDGQVTITGTQAIGTKLPNELGLYDMSGNVWEWCFDQWEEYTPYPTGKLIDYYASKGNGRVIRGGSWIREASLCSVGLRAGSDPAYSFYLFGFRVVRL